MRRWARSVVSTLPAPRDKAALRALAAARDLLSGRVPPPLAKPSESVTVRAVSALPRVTPLAEDHVWLPTPAVQNPGAQLSSIYDTGGEPERFDVALLEELNAEYASKPIVPHPPQYTAEALEAAAKRRITWVHNMVDLAGKRTLEIGCGNGFEVWSVANNLGADAHGVDVAHYAPWDQLAGDRVNFTCADMSAQHPFEPNSFDRVLSYTVWEHVTHPYAMLKATYDVLKPGGIAWIRANLYAGPQASHRYRDIFFPWPHLLFTDEVVREWDVKHGRSPIGHAWVNRLSSLHYDQYVREIGFETLHKAFTEAPIDEAFYNRFEGMLGRYPLTDLRRDYILMVLRKPEAN